MNKYITIAVLALIVFLLVFYRKKITLLFAKTKAAVTPAPATPAAPVTSLNRDKVLSLGSTGPEVSYLQHLLGIPEDGKFGPITEAALQDAKCFSTTTLNTFADQRCENFTDEEYHGDFSSGTDIFNSILSV